MIAVTKEQPRLRSSAKKKKDQDPRRKKRREGEGNRKKKKPADLPGSDPGHLGPQGYSIYIAD